jgi:hypothetical protein
MAGFYTGGENKHELLQENMFSRHSHPWSPSKRKIHRFL